MTRRLMNKKAFTLIELIVVIAILGVLVLLAAPKLLGYTNDAKLAQVKNDVKVVENALAIELIEDLEYMVNKGWGSVSLETMNGYVNEGSLFDTKGNVDGELLGGEFYLIEDELAKTNLNGQFIASEGGKVYYYENGLKLGGNESSNEVGKSDVDLGMESDFIWVNQSWGAVYENIEGQKGYFKYVGTGESTVEIPHVIQGVEMTNYYRMFYEAGKDVEKVISTNEKVTDMSGMFYNSQATTLELSSFDTSSVTDMSGMFYNNQATSLDLSSFDTSNVTNMDEMFRGSKATTLDLSEFDTTKVTNMSRMFYNSQADTLDLSSFDTSKVTDMGLMFRDSRVTTLDLSNFDTENVTHMGSMFWGSQATSLDLSSFDTSNVTNMDSMFRGSQAKSLDLSNFDTSNVTYMSYMFQNSRATMLDLSEFDTSNVTTMGSMFSSSQATTGYARSQEDADNFNASSTERPSGLKFIVKP